MRVVCSGEPEGVGIWSAFYEGECREGLHIENRRILREGSGRREAVCVDVAPVSGQH
jgi:hypothetical protein